MVGVLEGAVETKVRPAVVTPAQLIWQRPPASTDCALQDWQTAGLRAESYFRAYVLTVHRSDLTTIGHLSDRDWNSVKARVSVAFAK